MCRSVCNAQQSFAKEFDFAFNRGAKKEKALDQTVDTDSEEDMMQFILSVIFFLSLINISMDNISKAYRTKFMAVFTCWG